MTTLAVTIDKKQKKIFEKIIFIIFLDLLTFN